MAAKLTPCAPLWHSEPRTAASFHVAHKYSCDEGSCLPACRCETPTAAFWQRPEGRCQSGCPRTTWCQSWHNSHTGWMWELNSRWRCPWVSSDKSDLPRSPQGTGSDYLFQGKSRKRKWTGLDAAESSDGAYRHLDFTADIHLFLPWFQKSHQT